MSISAVPMKRMSFFGFGPIIHLDVLLNTYPDMYELDKRFPVDRSEIRMSLSFAAFNPEAISMGFLQCNHLFAVSRVGDSEICHYCGFMLVPGSTKCHRCSGERRDMIADSRYEKFGKCQIDAIEIRQRRSEVTEVHLDMIFLDAPTLSYYNENPFSGWFTTHVQDGWICKFCNGVVKDPALDCPHCGGGRLPFSDLEKMRLNCLYCGRPVLGNTVCQGCGASDNGYSIWMPRLDWN
jgi:hypothetical protein